MLRVKTLIQVAVALVCTQTLTTAQAQGAQANFNRIATFEVHRNVPTGRTVSKKSVAEIVAASEDGRLLAYTDSEQKGIGLIDISNPASPRSAGFVAVEGEPTSLVITHGKVLVAVDASKKAFQPEGHLTVIDISSLKIIDSCNLQGQPDSVALDKTGRNIVIAMENQRDEEFEKGAIPQLPAGNLSIMKLLAGRPDCTSLHPVAMTGLADIAPTDPEPEFVKVNAAGLAVVTMQENNHIAIVDVAKRQVVKHFSAGTVDLKGIDRKRDGIINPTDSAIAVPREPDGVAWLDNRRFVIANEGDYKGGSRSFSIMNIDGQIEFDSGAMLDHIAIRLGHYPERRSGSKGNEPEGVEVGVFGKEKLIFVGSERSSLITVWRDEGVGKAPTYLQALPSGTAPEGLLAIAHRNLLVVASENDDAARSSIMIYQRSEGSAAYPTLVSADTAAGTPIAWGAISGAAADRKQPGRLWAVTDSAYATTRILQIDATKTPALITQEITLNKNGKATGFDGEGITQRADGGFWIASEGDPAKKDGALNDLLLRVSASGEVLEEITLPESLRRHALRFGFEGVTTTGEGAAETVWIAVQREWKDDPKGLVKILSYQPASKTWGVLHYPLDKTSTEGRWMGLSEITAVGPDRFVVIERDNQFGDQSVKTLQTFSIAGLKPAAPGDAAVPVVSKRLLHNLLPDLQKPRGYVLDKVESFAIDAADNAFVITDNDGVDGSSGETQFIRLGQLPGLR